MKKLTDQELDSIFKSAAEAYQPPFDSTAWDAMDNKLNVRPGSPWRKWAPFAVVGVAIFFSGVWVGTRLIDSGEPMLQNETAESENELNNMEIKTEETLSIPNSNSILKVQPANGVVDKKSQQNYTEKLIQKEKGNENMAVVTAADHSIINENRVDESVIYTGEVPFLGLVNGQEKNVPDSVWGFERAEVPRDSANVHDEDEKVLKHSNRVHSFSVRLLASPDFTSINFYSTKELGSNYSVQLEYRLHPRLAVSTGVILSSKKYSSDKEVMYSGYPTYNLVGACRVVDVPVQFYYYLRPDKKTNFFTGLGSSSYLMLSEEYTYSIQSTYGSKQYTRLVERKNNEWFKMLNLSAGVQRAVGTQWHLQAEPFIKVPLSGVGEGDVLLSSWGVFIGVKYQIR